MSAADFCIISGILIVAFYVQETRAMRRRWDREDRERAKKDAE